MIIIGLILLILGYLLAIPVLITLGFIVLIVGLVLLVIGYAGHPVAGRRYWW